MQITSGLPVQKILDIEIIENNEPLVEVKETEEISLLSEHKFLRPYLRKTVHDMLVEASKNIPKGYKLLVVTCFRSIEMQSEMYWNRKKQLAKKFPFMMIFRYKEWLRMVGTYTAPPGGSPHHTGSAIDLTVIGPDGERLDMGTSLIDYGIKVHMINDKITQKQAENRKLLRDAMMKAGFAYYPLEWWHYCYGDRMWAAYTEHKQCFYGPLNDFK